MRVLRFIFRVLPTVILSLIMATAVWITAVTASDPTQERVYPRPVPIEIIGQDSGLVITGQIPEQVNLTLSAPNSVWNRLLREQAPIRAILDLSGLEAGSHRVNVQIQIGIRPIEIVTCTPCTLNVNLEAIANRTMPVRLLRIGEVAIGFEADMPYLSQTSVIITGPESLVRQVWEVRAELNISQANSTISRSIDLKAVDTNEREVKGISITPKSVNVTLNVKQRGGYRNVVVKAVLGGQLAAGYRVTNISVFPPAVTVFSSDPKLVEQLPGYVETAALDLSGAKDDLDANMPLNLPPGVSVVGESLVQVQVGIATIEGSLTIENIPVEIVGVPEDKAIKISPETVDVILSGPLPVLDTLTAKDIRVFINMADQGMGTFQRIPIVELKEKEVKVDSILPASIEIVIQEATPTPKPK